ncbi:MAG: SufD family Fe-S cluster assembly protein [Xanthomonadaceae bacterium]|nr:SufD family Fe-S cluster assembly protein [Xanthomonadaceae bacterium]
MIAAPSVKDENYRFTSLRSINWNEAPETIPVSANSDVLPLVFRNDAFADLNRGYAPDTKRILVTGKQSGTKVSIGHHFESCGAIYSRVIVEVAPNVNVTLVEELLGSPRLLNQVLEIRLGEGSVVEWVHLQNLSRSTLGFLRTLVTLEAGSELKGIISSVGGSKNQSRVEVCLKGERAQATLMSATRGIIDQHFDHWTTITHDAGKTTSSFKHWTVMGDQARAIFNGKVVIPAHALGCDAYQKNTNLLLSKQAVIDSIPKLEIATDEVKCAHGSSISPVSDDHLYYLESRGIDRAMAEGMLVDGFTEPVLMQISDDVLRSQIRLALVGHASDGGWE